MSEKWIVCADGGVEEFDTEAEALASAQEWIEGFNGDKWDEEVENILVARVTHRSVQTNIVDRPGKLDEDGCDEDGNHWPIDWAYKCDYEMQAESTP